MSYEKELDFTKALALEAGEIMQKYFRTDDLGHEWKEDKTPVTIADTTINKLVIERVKAKFPKHGILGEEESHEPDRDLIWVLDPIDGTVPFSLGIPTCAFSIALVNKADGQPLVAVTHDPFLNETYSAISGGGAFLNDKSIEATIETDLNYGYMCLSSRNGKGPGYDYRASIMIEDLRAEGVKLFNYMSLVYGANRVASGQFLATVIGTASAWDMAACALLVKEAGGIVTDLTGQQRRFDEEGDGCIMAANSTIHRYLLEKIRTENANFGD